MRLRRRIDNQKWIHLITSAEGKQKSEQLPGRFYPAAAPRRTRKAQGEWRQEQDKDFASHVSAPFY